MAAVAEYLFSNPEDPPMGTILGQRFQLVTKFYTFGEARYLARDLRAPGQDVELRLGHFNGRRYAYRIKSRFKRGRAVHLKRARLPRQINSVSRLDRVKEALGISQLSGRRELVEEVA
jgi:hypothetical protein